MNISTPIIILSAELGDYLESALSEGASFCLRKPSDLNELKKALIALDLYENTSSISSSLSKSPDDDDSLSHHRCLLRNESIDSLHKNNLVPAEPLISSPVHRPSPRTGRTLVEIAS